MLLEIVKSVNEINKHDRYQKPYIPGKQTASKQT